MIVGYFRGIGVIIAPFKTNAPLIVDADAVLANSIAFELLEPVARRHPKVLKGVGRIKDQKLPQCQAQHLRRQPPSSFTLKEGLSVSIGERFDHRCYNSALH